MAKLGLLDDYDGPLIYGKIKSDKWLLMNTIYKSATRETNFVDYAYFVLKDVTTGEKKLVTVPNPPMLAYFVKEQYRDYQYYPSYKPLSETEAVPIRYARVVQEIAKRANLEKYLADIGRENFALARNLHKWPYVLATDYNYADYMRIEWALHYHNRDIKAFITKMFLDIEVDGIDVPGFPQMGECPINAVSLIDEASSTVFVFLLNNPKNPQIKEFMDTIESFYAELHEAFDEFYGVMDYRISMYDDELLMIDHIFQLINRLKRDFVAIWNMPFDIPYIIARIKALGAEPKDIMCHPDFKTNILYYKKDTLSYDFKKKNDKFYLSSYTVFTDQLSNYIRMRKGKSELKNNKLNSVAQKELGDEKLDYSDEADIKTLPYKNYRKFVMYNIKDTLLQLGIERKTNDLMSIFLSTIDNATGYNGIFSQSVVLQNAAYLSYYKQGYIIGNNRNTHPGEKKIEDVDKKTKEVEGALVGEPELNRHTGMKIFGSHSKYIFNSVIDFDLNVRSA
jgi:hypothetical protein